VNVNLFSFSCEQRAELHNSSFDVCMNSQIQFGICIGQSFNS
jgi:hypothetical protein